MGNIIRNALTTALPMVAVAGFSMAADRALVIGIDTYPTTDFSQELTQASADAQRFHDFLIESWDFPADGVTLLQNEDATSSAIMASLIDNLVGETALGDRAVLYFAGLGSQITSGSTSEKALLAYDIRSVLGKIPQSAISDILDIIADRKVSVVIDASFAGEVTSQLGSVTLARGVDIGGFDASIDDIGTIDAPFGTGVAERAVWNASAPGQIAWETPGGGVFTSILIDSLQAGTADANGNGTTTNAELLSYAREYSSSWCATNTSCSDAGRGLTPHFSGPVQLSASGIEKVIVAPPVDDIVVRVEDGPVTFQETLGFVTDLFTPSNDANLEIAINADEPLKLGEVISFSAQADRDGTLVLFDINPNGELAQLFPSVLSADGATKIASGAELTIPNGLSLNGQPMQIRVSEPAGQGFLLGLFIEDDLPALDAVLPENLNGDPIPNAGRYLYEIAQELLKLQADADGSRAVEWSSAYLPYEIIR